MVCDYLPQDRELRYHYKYYCPICLRYFNCMLLSQCCFNYLCHYCADEIVERERNIEAYVASCPYKCEGKFVLKDVNPNAQIKRYSDSQYMSFYSNNLGKVTVGGGGAALSNGFSAGKTSKNMDKENIKSPLAGETPYDPFGDKEYKKKYFQNSANNFLQGGGRGYRRTSQILEVFEGQNGEDYRGAEESKASGGNPGMMHRTEAIMNPNYRRPPLQQIRQNMIRLANQGAAASDGFAINQQVLNSQRRSSNNRSI